MTNLQEPADQPSQPPDLDREIERARLAGRKRAIAEIVALMDVHGLTVADLDQAPVRTYRHPLSGETWNGRGKKPQWLVAALAAGRALEDYAT